jgi:hypothetical protein
MKAQIPSSNNFPLIEELAIQEGMPDPFIRPDRSRVNSTKEWSAQRVYLKALLAHYLYGKMPPRPKQFDVKLITRKPVFDKKAIHERYAITLNENNKTFTFHFEVIRPIESERLPVIIKNCFTFFEGTTGKEKARAKHDKEAAMEAVSRGYLLCKFNRREVAADHKDNRNTGVFPLYPDYDWGTIAAWAWAHGVVADALDKLEFIDMKKIIATGHSRGGKVALCAGIYDERIEITAPNSSGTGGTGSLRYFEKGQKEQRLGFHKNVYAHWWKKSFFDFEGKEEYLPFDAHTAKALIAPRALINTHARQDYWANPYGTELTYRAADMVFEWLGAKDKQGIHWREGVHNQGKEDWAALLDFADREFFNKETKRSFTALTYPEASIPINWKLPKTKETQSIQKQ